MKRLFIFCTTCIALTSNAQTTLTLQPGKEGKDGIVDSHVRNYPGGETEELNAVGWTVNGIPAVERGLIEFDLTAIPTNAIVQSAYLTLYYNPTSVVGGGQSSLTKPNEGRLQRVMASWDEATISWDTQPPVDTTQYVILPKSDSLTQNYTLDVKTMTQRMVDSPAANYGFLIRMLDEGYYHSLTFASSDHPNAALHPKLVITYTMPPATAIASISGLDKEVNVYPNPVLQTLHVDFANTTVAIADVQLTDVSGRTLLRKSGQIAANEHVSVDVRSLPRGNYFLKVTQDNKTKYNSTITLQ